MSNIFTNFSIIALLLFISSIFIFVEDLFSNIAYLLKIVINSYICSSYTTFIRKPTKITT